MQDVGPAFESSLRRALSSRAGPDGCRARPRCSRRKRSRHGGRKRLRTVSQVSSRESPRNPVERVGIAMVAAEDVIKKAGETLALVLAPA